RAPGAWMPVSLGPQRNGQAQPDIAAEPAYGTFRCGDGKLLTLSIAHEDWFWSDLCRLLGMEDAAALRRTERVAQFDALRGRIERALAQAPRADWAPRLDEAAIPWGPVNDLQEVVEDPHLDRKST